MKIGFHSMDCKLANLLASIYNWIEFLLGVRKLGVSEKLNNLLVARRRLKPLIWLFCCENSSERNYYPNISSVKPTTILSCTLITSSMPILLLSLTRSLSIGHIIYICPGQYRQIRYDILENWQRTMNCRVKSHMTVIASYTHHHQHQASSPSAFVVHTEFI